MSRLVVPNTHQEYTEESYLNNSVLLLLRLYNPSYPFTLLPKRTIINIVPVKSIAAHTGPSQSKLRNITVNQITSLISFFFFSSISHSFFKLESLSNNFFLSFLPQLLHLTSKKILYLFILPPHSCWGTQHLRSCHHNHRKSKNQHQSFQFLQYTTLCKLFTSDLTPFFLISSG